MTTPKDNTAPSGFVYINVSGLTGSGKSAVLGEIEIALKAVGLTVEHDAAFQAEKNATHADWQAALDLYKPVVVLSETNISRSTPPADTEQTHSDPFEATLPDNALLDIGGSKLTWAEIKQRLAAEGIGGVSELDDISAAIATYRFMDPPDGGDVSLAEQVRRMKAALDAAEAQLSPLPANEAWIPWTGGENPVPGIDVEHQGQSITENVTADRWPDLWRHIDPEDNMNIIAYRIAQPEGGEG